MQPNHIDKLNLENVEAELDRERNKRSHARNFRGTVALIISAAAIAVLLATLWMPVLQIYGSSMTPTLEEGQIVVAVKNAELKEGDLVAFYYGNKLLVKRYIAGPGSWVDIKNDGTVHVNGELLNEPYVQDPVLGDCNIKLPYQVPEGRNFVLGDHRTTSVDSRNTALGCVAEEQIVGKIVFRVWPLNKIGKPE